MSSRHSSRYDRRGRHHRRDYYYDERRYEPVYNSFVNVNVVQPNYWGANAWAGNYWRQPYLGYENQGYGSRALYNYLLTSGNSSSYGSYGSGCCAPVKNDCCAPRNCGC